MKNAKICVILNAISGHANINNKVASLKKVFAEFNVEPDIELVTYGTRAEDKAEEALKKGHDIIVAVGGDGTISAVAEKLLNTNVPLGIIPGGTLNHFAKDLGIPTKLQEAVSTILFGKEKNIDVASVNEHVFINNSGIGLYPKIVQNREEIQNGQGKSKWFAFWIALRKVWNNYPFLKIEVSSKEETFSCTTPFVFIGNNEYSFEGLNLGTRENLEGNRLSVYIAKKSNKRGVIKFFWLALIGKLLERDDFEFFETEELTIESTKKFLQVSIDGEVTPLQTPLQYKILPKSLKVLVKE